MAGKKKSTVIRILLGIAGIAIFSVFSFVPLINMSYEAVVQKQVSEEYTTVEPYIVQEEIKEPYQSSYDKVIWEYYTEPAIWGTSFGEQKILRPRIEQIPITKYRTVPKEVTKYRELTKTRMVYRPVVETRTKRVSLLRYLLR